MSRGSRCLDRGAAAVEMAIILPVLVLLVGAIIDLGRVFMVTSALSNAAREGTRYATVVGDASTSASKTAIEQRAQRAAQDMGVWDTGAPTAQFTYACTTTDEMDVVVSASFSWVMLHMLPGVTNPRTMTGKSVIGC